MAELTPRTPSALDALAEEWLDTELELHPEGRVMLGRPGSKSQYADYSPDGAAADADAERSVLARVKAAEPVDEVDRITKAELIRTLELEHRAA